MKNWTFVFMILFSSVSFVEASAPYDSQTNEHHHSILIRLMLKKQVQHTMEDKNPIKIATMICQAVIDDSLDVHQLAIFLKELQEQIKHNNTLDGPEYSFINQLLERLLSQSIEHLNRIKILWSYKALLKSISSDYFILRGGPNGENILYDLFVKNLHRRSLPSHGPPSFPANFQLKPYYNNVSNIRDDHPQIVRVALALNTAALGG